ncbi:MBL fold metallo-hydrolase [bacterium]|nr:MBL fold metallo-hydrolase [bacterium]MCI0607377.1 MBL fold metallo-hydrolase [bacterium]
MIQHHVYEEVHYWQVARAYAGKYLYATGFFYLDSALIDCGPINMARPLDKLFSGLNATKIIVTHHHEDHTGNLHGLLQRRGIQCFAHARSESLLRQTCIEIPFWRRLIWGRPEPASITPIAQQAEMSRYNFEVILTPGHSEDHICLFAREKGWLFTGDLYLASYLRYLRDDENIYEIMNSLRKLIDLHPSVVFCNHRGFIAEGEKQLAKKLSFLEELRDQILRANEEGVPVEDFLSKKFRHDHFFRWVSHGEFSTINLIQAFLKQKPNVSI